MSRRAITSFAIGAAGAAALVLLYVGIVSVAQGTAHALQLLSDDRGSVALIGAGFGTQVGLFAYVRSLQGALARESVALTGAGTATSSASMVACCAHHLADVMPIVGLSGVAVFLVDYRTPLMLLGLATTALGIVVMVRELRRVHRIVARAASRSSPGAQAFA